MPWGSTPDATLLQVPTLPARLQDLQAVLHALLQQTPCAQKPLTHSVPTLQVAPGGLRPQLLIMPFMPQMLGVMQSAVTVQALKHFVALQ